MSMEVIGGIALVAVIVFIASRIVKSRKEGSGKVGGTSKRPTKHK